MTQFYFYNFRTPPESSTSSPPAEPAEVLEPTGGDPESSPVGDP